MRVTKLMGVAVVVVGLGVALNALAFKTASVTNSASFMVTATKDAALAIEDAQSPADTGFHADSASPNSLSLIIDDQMQPNSTYKFSNVFQIAHKASNTATPITNVKYSTTIDPTVAVVKLYKAGTTTVVNNETINNGVPMAVDLEIQVLSGTTLGSKSFNITITGQQ